MSCYTCIGFGSIVTRSPKSWNQIKNSRLNISIRYWNSILTEMSINIDNNHTKCAKAELSAKINHLPHYHSQSCESKTFARPPQRPGEEDIEPSRDHRPSRSPRTDQSKSFLRWFHLRRSFRLETHLKLPLGWHHLRIGAPWCWDGMVTMVMMITEVILKKGRFCSPMLTPA